MIAFTVVVLKELANCITQRSLTEENQSAKALFLHRSHEPLNMSLEIGRSLWQSQTGETHLPQGTLENRGRISRCFHLSDANPDRLRPKTREQLLMTQAT